MIKWEEIAAKRAMRGADERGFPDRLRWTCPHCRVENVIVSREAVQTCGACGEEVERID